MAEHHREDHRPWKDRPSHRGIPPSFHSDLPMGCTGKTANFTVLAEYPPCRRTGAT